MTPNKLPPLPEPEHLEWTGQSFDQTEAFTADQMHAYAAEALRQSQSLPAGAVAVAGLVAKWREIAEKNSAKADYLNESGDSSDAAWCEAAAEHRFYCADELEQALQADAREKGEEASGKVNGYLFSQRAIEVIVDGEIPEWMSRQPGIRVTITPEGATQPAQASEKDYRQIIEDAIKIRQSFDSTVEMADWLRDALATSSQETASE